MLLILTIAGGVTLLLFAVRYLRKGLDRLLGSRLGRWMEHFSRTPLRALFAGLGVAVVAPSSTTVSLLAVHSVRAGLLAPRKMLLVMLGANIGLTVMVQVLALDIQQYAPIFVLVGGLLFLYTSRARPRGTGQVILALGFLFLGIDIMKQATGGAGLAANGDVMQVVAVAERHGVALAGLAALLALVLQSSTATIALVIGLGGSGIVSLPAALTVVVGANVGMSVTTLVVGWSHVESRRLALANLLAKLVVAAVALAALAAFGRRLPAVEPAALPFWIAQAHTGFNIVVAAIGVPMAGPLTRCAVLLVPAVGGERARAFGPKFIFTGPIESVPLALGQSTREILHVSEIVRGMLRDVWTALREDDEVLARDVSERDDQVDLLDERIKRFLTRLVREESDDTDADEQLRQLRYLSELETIGDIVDKNLVELVLKKIRRGASFSADGARELDDFHAKVVENLDIADTVFTGRDRALAQRLLRHKERLGRYEQELRDRHFERLNRTPGESLETSAIHLDLLTHLQRINSALSRVALEVLRES